MLSQTLIALLLMAAVVLIYVFRDQVGVVREPLIAETKSQMR